MIILSVLLFYSLKYYETVLDFFKERGWTKNYLEKKFRLNWGKIGDNWKKKGLKFGTKLDIEKSLTSIKHLNKIKVQISQS